MTERRALEQDKPVLANLLQLYLHDLSEFLPLELTPHGTYTYPYLDLYFREPDREPYFIDNGDALAGFALLRREQETWSIAEFFIARAHRRTGLGRAAAQALLALHPGPWTLTFTPANKTAETFWRTVISPTAERTLTPPEVSEPRTLLHFQA